MKKLLSIAALSIATSVLAVEPRQDIEKLAKPFASSLVVVEYELQYDEADAPEGGIGAERCPGCGQFHDNDLRKYLEEERPIEAPGYLVAPDRVVTKDPQLHPRFIKTIKVRQSGDSVGATVHSHALTEQGLILALESKLPDAKPLQFVRTNATPAASTDLNWQLGQWSLLAMPYSESSVLPGTQAGWRYTQNTGVAIARNGDAQGLVLDGWLSSDGAWQGSPLDWPQESAAALNRRLDSLRGSTRAAIHRVHLTFRSPRSGSDGMAGYRGRYGRFASQLDEDATEADVPGVLLADGKLVVLANLDPKTTARLEGIKVHPGEGEPITANFFATIKDLGVFVALLEKPIKGGIKTAGKPIASYHGTLLLRADVEFQGESRRDHFQTARFSTFQKGSKGRLLPMLDGVAPQEAFIFTLDGEWVAVSAERRSQNSSQSSYSSEQSDLVPATELMKLVAGLPGTADNSNVPVSEEEENKLAWLGAELQPMNQELARANGVSTLTRDGETGGLVTFVHPGSPAAKAGISVGSVLLRLKVAGRPLPLEVQVQDDAYRGQSFPWERLDEVPAQYFDRIPSPWSPVENTFIRAVTDLGFGTKYTLEYFADGKAQSKVIEVEAGPAHYESAPRYKSEALGATVRDLTYEVRRYLQRKADEPGVVVSKIEPGGRAGVAGVRPYELITHVNDQPVNNVKDFEKLAAAAGEVKLSVKRMAKGRIVTVKAAN